MEGHDWQVLNELDSGRGQGWGGTLEDYLLFTQYTNDAIQTVYNLPALQGKTFRLYAPVAKSMNTWVAESLRLNATMIDRIDWHNYSTSHYDNAVQARAWSAQYSPSAGSDNIRLSLPWEVSRMGGYRQVGGGEKGDKSMVVLSNVVVGRKPTTPATA